MLSHGLKVALALALAAMVAAFVYALDDSFGGKPKHESAADVILLAAAPDEPQRAIVIVHSSKVEAGVLTLELELRNNSDSMLTGNVWGQALLATTPDQQPTRLIESQTRLSYKARIKTFKTLRFALPAATDGQLSRIEVFVSDDSTGLVTKYGEPAPKPAA